MKRIKFYTLGWDTQNKEGYLSLTDESDEKHLLSRISTHEFSMMLLMLHQGDVFWDNQNWLITGWKPEAY
ncbi:MAG: hypothetical protein ACK4NY_10150 [Spirosomataceae bacterium]